MPDDIRYLAIIAQSIDDFNEIFDSLAAKSVEWGPDDADTSTLFPSPKASESPTPGVGTLGRSGYLVSSGISTADYAGLIRRQLFRIAGINTAQVVPGVENGILTSYAGTTVTSNSNVTNPITIGADGIIVKIPSSGYYTANTSSVVIPSSMLSAIAVPGSISGSTPSASANNVLSLNQATNKYELVGSNNLLLSEVTVDVGSMTIAHDGIDLSGITSTPSIDSITTDLSEVSLASAADNTKYSLNFTIDTTLSGTASITASAANFVPGYIKSSPASVTATKTYGSGQDQQSPTGSTAQYYINIQKGGISGLRGEAAISSISYNTTDVTIANSVASGSENNYYSVEVTPSAQVNFNNIQITEGYIKSTDTASITSSNETVITPTTYYLKKGNIPDYTNTNVNPTIASSVLNPSTGEINGTASGGLYTLTATVSETDTQAITSGYIADTKTNYGIDLSGSLDFYIKQGSIGTTTVTNVLTPALTNASSLTELTGSATNPYNTPTIEFTSSATLTRGQITTGYIKSSDTSDGRIQLASGTNTDTTKTYYIKPGYATVTTTIGSSFTDTNDLTDETVDNTAILTTTQPSSGDYYTITASSAVTSLTPGWFGANNNITITNGSTYQYYLPKAVLEYVTDSTTGADFIQVTTGGYLPSGYIGEIASISGTLDYASVGLSYTDDFSDTLSAETDYTITVSKNQTTTSAGYFSGTADQGDLTNNTVSVTHGSVSVTEVSNQTFHLSTVPQTVSNGAAYKFLGSGTVQAGVTVTEGYIKQADVGGLDSGQTYKTFTTNADLQLPRGSLQITAGNSNFVNIIPGTGHTITIDSTEQSPYYIVPIIDPTNNTVHADGQAGYLTQSDIESFNLSISNDSNDKLYIKSGTQLTTVANNGANADNTTTYPLIHGWNSTTNKYDVSLASHNIPVTGTLEEGYYGSTITTVSGNATVAARELHINAAAATVSVSTTNTSIDSPAGSHNAVIYSSAPANYVQLSTTAQVNFATPAVTAGYLQSASQITLPQVSSTPAVSTTVNAYLEKYSVPSESGRKVGQASDQYDIPEGLSETYTAQTLTLQTANKYVDQDITVTLTDNAMGPAVWDEMRTLRRRLAGLSTTVSS